MAQEEEKSSAWDYDVLIIGGGPAGLSAAMTLGRFLHKVLVCDDNRPRNLKAIHAQNLPISDGIPPLEWRAKVRENLKRYKTVTVEQGAKVTLLEKYEKNENKLFKATIETVDSKQTRDLIFRKVILAYGMIDGTPTPAIEGFDELWGKSVLHCPFCHGYEVRDKKLGLWIEWAGMAHHLAPVLYGLSKDLIIFTNGKADMFKNDPKEANEANEANDTNNEKNGNDEHKSNEDIIKQWESKGIKIINDKIVSLKYDKNDLTKLNGIVLSNGEIIERDAIFYGQNIPLKLKSDFAEKLGCEKTEFGHIKVNDKGLTTVEGVYAAGDVSTFSSVLSSASLGQDAAAAIVFLLAEENFAM